MVAQYLRQLENLNQFQTIVSLLFFLLFCVILYLVIRSDKKSFKDFGNIPLEFENDFTNSLDKKE